MKLSLISPQKAGIVQNSGLCRTTVENLTVSCDNAPHLKPTAETTPPVTFMIRALQRKYLRTMGEATHSGRRSVPNQNSRGETLLLGKSYPAMFSR